MLTVEFSDTERQYGNFFVFGRDAGGVKKITFFDNLGKRVKEALIQEYFIACLTGTQTIETNKKTMTNYTRQSLKTQIFLLWLPDQ
jgi:hypothetical protein